MASPARVHAELIGFLRQHCPVRDQRHLVLLAWMVAGLLLSETAGLPQSLRSGRSELLAHWLKPVKSKPRWRARSLMNQPWRVKSQL